MLFLTLCCMGKRVASSGPCLGCSVLGESQQASPVLVCWGSATPPAGNAAQHRAEKHPLKMQLRQ